ncbi:MAG: hypothetical protein WCF57_18040 [Pyrinomonadaceae bacterium]
MSAFPITIDATQLCNKSLLIYGDGQVQVDWFDSTVTQTFPLQPGEYKFQIGSGSFAAFNFTVTPKGLVNYDKSLNKFIEGRGTSKLTLKGLTVTLDARYISSTVLYLIELYEMNDHITNTTWNMLPAEYSLVVGSGQRANFNFSLKGDGTFAYDRAYECKPNGSGGFLRGARTPKLEFLGYPVMVDARAAGGDGVGLEDLGLPFSPSAVQFANLLPASNYPVWYNSETNARAVFNLELNGKISLPPEVQPPIIEVKKFHDLTLLVIAPTQP